MTENIIQGTFRFADGPLVRDREADYLYTDDFFRRDARKSDPALRRMSFAFCMSCFPSTEAKNYERVYRHAETLLAEIGFADFCANADYERPPEQDTLGMLAAHKIIRDPDGDFSVVAVGLRSADYGDEWTDNILLGESGEARGFAIGAAQLDAFLRSYLARTEEKLLPRVKLWMSGYSRVAAIVNLEAAKLDSGEDARVRTEDLFVYTFECPAAAPATDDSPHPSIHNYLNPHDLVPYLAPAAWGFRRYGVDETNIPRIESEKFWKKIGAVRERIAALNPDLNYDVTDFQPVMLRGTDFRELRACGDLRGKRRPEGWWYRARQDDYLARFLEFMSRTGTSELRGAAARTDADRRRAFARGFEAAASQAARIYFGATAKERHRMRKNIENLVDFDLRGLRKIRFYLLLRRGTEEACRKAAEMLGELLRRRALRGIRGEAAVAAREKELDHIFAAVAELVHYFLRCAAADASRNHFMYLPTLIHNLDRIVVSHLPEVIYAWL